MKALFIGGTGTISTAISKKLIEQGTDLYLINRGSRNDILGTEGVTYLTCDINNEAEVIVPVKSYIILGLIFLSL